MYNVNSKQKNTKIQKQQFKGVYFVRNYSTAMNSTTRKEQPETIRMSCFATEKQDNIISTIQHYLHRSEVPEFQTLRVLSYARYKVIIKDLRKEEERVKTFQNFPQHFKHLIKPLARTGFYSYPRAYASINVKCIYCQGPISIWNAHDKPIIKHKKYFPTCPFIINLDVANLPEENEKLKELQIDKELEKFHGKIAYNVIRPKESRSYCTKKSKKKIIGKIPSQKNGKSKRFSISRTICADDKEATIYLLSFIIIPFLRDHGSRNDPFAIGEMEINRNVF